MHPLLCAAAGLLAVAAIYAACWVGQWVLDRLVPDDEVDCSE